LDGETPYNATRARVKRYVIRNLLINGLAPFLVYLLAHRYTSSFTALVCAAAPPMLENLWSLVRRHRLDLLAMVVLGGISLGLVMIALGGSPRLLLVRESLISGIVGLVFLASLAFRRPLIFHLGRELMAGDEATRPDLWEDLWSVTAFRRGMQLMTLVWGAGLALEAVTRVGLALTVHVETFLVLSPFVQYGIMGSLIAWTVWFSRRMRANVRAVVDPDNPAPAA